MLRGDDHICGSEEGVTSCGEDLEFPVRVFLKAFDLEQHGCAFGLADPVALHELDALRPVDKIQVIQESLSICCYLQDPLADVLLLHLCSATLALSFLDLFIGKSGLAVGAPVDGSLTLIGKALLKELLEDPLCPVIIVRITC